MPWRTLFTHLVGLHSVGWRKRKRNSKNRQQNARDARGDKKRSGIRSGKKKEENKAKTAQRVDKNDLWAIIMNYFDT